MSTTAQRKAQTAALITLLQNIPDQQLADILAALSARGRITITEGGDKRHRVCGICGLPYALCQSRRLADDDHVFEASDARK